MITYKIYGMHSRDEMIYNLQNQLDIKDSDVYYDDRPNGGLALYTAKKAWLSPIEPGETHRVVFPDDVEVCDNFKSICEQITTTHPDKIISLFCFEGITENSRFNNLSTPYLESKFVIGIGLIIPVEYIKPCFDWIKKTYDDNIADDIGIQHWAKYNNVKVITTIPSLVQHLGDDSILTPNMPIRRSKYFEKNPSGDWANTEISQILMVNNFKPKSKMVIKPNE